MENFEYEIVHPFRDYKEDRPISKMDKIKVNVEFCTLLKGKP